jgi:hypothetical protein
MKIFKGLALDSMSHFVRLASEFTLLILWPHLRAERSGPRRIARAQTVVGAAAAVARAIERARARAAI